MVHFVPRRRRVVTAAPGDAASSMAASCCSSFPSPHQRAQGGAPMAEATQPAGQEATGQGRTLEGSELSRVWVPGPAAWQVQGVADLALDFREPLSRLHVPSQSQRSRLAPVQADRNRQWAHSRARQPSAGHPSAGHSGAGRPSLPCTPALGGKGESRKGEVSVGGKGERKQEAVSALAAAALCDFGSLHGRMGYTGPDELLFRRVMETAVALQNSDLATFQSTFRWLSQFASPRGPPGPRLLHYLLQGLLLRCSGLGYSAFNSPCHRSPREIETSRNIYYKISPTALQMQQPVASTICQMSRGRDWIHILEFGALMVPQWPAVFRRLSQQHKQHWQQQQQQHQQQQQQQQQQQHGQQNKAEASSPEAGVQGEHIHEEGSADNSSRQQEQDCPPLQVRLSMLRMTRLIHPGRSDLIQLSTEKQSLALWLKVSAANAGVSLETEMFDVDEETLPQLTVSLTHRAGEALFVVAGWDFDYLLDNSVLEFGIRETILEWIRSLDPVVLLMVGIDQDSNNLPFLQRLHNTCCTQAAMFASHEALGRGTGEWEAIFVFEEVYLGRGIPNMVACEGPERVLRCQSQHRWTKCMAAAGLVPGPLFGLDEAYALVKRFPDGYGIGLERNSIRLNWKGESKFAFSAWVPGLAARGPV